MPPVTSESIRNDVRTSINVVLNGYRDFPWHEPVVYGNWLAQTSSFVRHATRLLSFAAARCSFDEQALHEKLIQGVQEERGHELLALADLSRLGMNKGDFPELAPTSAYYQTLYYAIDHDGPAALLGFFLPLEGMAALHGASELALVCKTYGPEAATFLQVHCEADKAHFENGLGTLDNLEMNQLVAVQKNLHYSAVLYCEILAEIRRLASAPSNL